MKSEHALHDLLGIEIQDLDIDLKKYNPPYRGVMVTEVFPDGLADKAGIIEKDIILSFNGKKVGSTRDLFKLIAGLSVNDEIKIDVNRKSTIRTFTANNGKREDLIGSVSVNTEFPNKYREDVDLVPMLNFKHTSKVDLYHKISINFFATYSILDGYLKIWNNDNYKLLYDYKCVGPEITALFSIGDKLFAQSKSSLICIDLISHNHNTIYEGFTHSSNVCISDSFIYVITRPGKFKWILLKYDYKNNLLYKLCYIDTVNFAIPYQLLLSEDNRFAYISSSDQKTPNSFKELAIHPTQPSLYDNLIANDNDDRVTKEYCKAKWDVNINEFSIYSNCVDITYKNSSKTPMEIEAYIYDRNNLFYNISFNIQRYNSLESDNYIIIDKCCDDSEPHGATERIPIDCDEGIWAISKKTHEKKIKFHEHFNTQGSGGMWYDCANFIWNDLVAIEQVRPFTKSWIFKDTKGNLVGTINEDALSEQLLPFDNHYIVLKKNGIVDVYDKNIIKLFSLESQFTVVDIKIVGQAIHVFSDINTEKIWDLNNGQLLLTKYTLKNGVELSITPEGFYSGIGDYVNYIHFVKGNEIYNLDQLYDVFYRPDLVQAKIAGDPDGLVAEAASKLNLDILIAQGAAPKISFLSPLPGVSPIRDITIEAVIANQGGGIGKAVWKLNGQTIGVVEDDRGIKVIPTTSNKPIIISKLITLSPEQNLIELIVYNKAGGMRSAPATLNLSLKDAVSEPPALHILAIGINKYRDKSLWLNNAVPDATEIVKQLQLTGKGVFEKIDKIELYDQDATMPAIAQAFAQTAEKDKTNDVFILYLAGHGITLDGRYHFLPADFRYRNEDSVRQKAINQDHLQKWLASLDSRKSLVLLDTCNSGSFTEAQTVTRGIAEKTAIDKLTRATGRATIAASTDSQVAYEGYKGHGVFTYALLQALSQADQKHGNNDNVTTTSELAAFIDELVPKITYQKWGYEQVPQVNLHGRTFPIGVVK